MKTTLTIIFTLLAVSSAQTIVSITSPLSGTKLKAGSDAVISWVNPTVPTISQIVLAKGPSNALQPVTTIATNIETASGKYVWKIPYEIENGAEYAFELGTSPDLAFAGPFSIEGGVGGTLPSSNATSSGASSAVSTAPTSSAVAPAAPSVSSAPAASVPATSPSGNPSPPTAAASNAKVPAAGSSPTGTSSATQVSSNGGKFWAAAAAAAVVFTSRLF